MTKCGRGRKWVNNPKILQTSYVRGGTCPLGWLVGRRVVGNFSLLILFMVRRKRAIVIAHRRHFLLERGRENERNIDRQASQSKR